jgi:tungstate transport system substrate-binding protein
MRAYGCLQTALICAVLVLSSQPEGHAAQPSVNVGAPTEAIRELLTALAPAFAKDTGLAVTVTPVGNGQGTAGLGAVVVHDGWTGQGSFNQGERTAVFTGERILIGSRAERARVRGLRDIKAAFRAISLTRGTFVSSSPELGARDLELSLWDALGVNVRSRSTWYVEVEGSETAVLSGAGDLGAYVLVERATYAEARNKRGLELLVAGDPLLTTSYSSVLLDPQSKTARVWHEWLNTPRAQLGISEFRLNGMEVFKPRQSVSEIPGPEPS